MLAVSPGRSTFLHIGRMGPNPRWRIAAHSHAFHELIVVLRGCLRLRLAGEEVRARPGDLLLYHAGCVHAESSDPADPAETCFFSFQGPEAAAWPWRMQDHDGRVRQLADWLYVDRHESGAEARQARDAVFHSLLCELSRLCARGARASDLVADLGGYIQQHLAEPLPLARLARQAGLSKFHFCRRFRQEAGRSPMEEVRVRRMSRARDLLQTTSLPMKAIAAAVGLSDEFRLSHLFRRYHGATPSSLRRKAGAG
ncbi:MAG: AraC family transcriptional regulator [Opitutales bacterium]|nr:AraC family transcriptional regulator [Opitutales bacterium]